MAEIKSNRSRQKQKPRGRGRQPNAVVGDYESLLNKIHAEEDRFDVEVANKLQGFYQDMILMAEGKLTLTKDQLKVIEMCIKRAEKILDDHYAEEDGESSLPKPDIKKDEVAKPLISLVAKKA